MSGDDEIGIMVCMASVLTCFVGTLLLIKVREWFEDRWKPR